MVARFLLLWMSAVVVATPIVAEETRAVAVIPRPMKMTLGRGEFALGPGPVILFDRDVRNEGEYLAEWLGWATGLKLEIKPIGEQKEQANCIVLRLAADKQHLGAEGYQLRVLPDRVLVEGPRPAGVFYGCQTILQLLPHVVADGEKLEKIRWTLPQVRIEDKPRFAWRGLMLDTGRCYYHPDWIKRYIDRLAYYKMNRFHWHLTERVGWRIEIKKYPELVRHGIHNTDADKNPLPEGKTVREYYTQDEIREIIAYARFRHVMVIPEIEMPGHSRLATDTYPEMLACVDLKGRVPAHLVNRAFCAGNDRAYEFIDGVLSEVAELFPAPWIHIGGDEPLMQSWAVCSRCQSRIQAEHLENVHGLYNYFVRRVEKIVRSKGKRLYGWEEVGGAGLSPTATIQSWHGTGPGLAAAQRGQDCVMSPAGHCYLDQSYRRVSVARSYSFEPMPPGLPADKARHILGVEAPMWMDAWRRWAQYRPRTGTLARVDSQVFPRLIALSEVGWSPKARRDWDDFKQRLKLHGVRLRWMGINYYRDPQIWPPTGAER